MVTAMLLKAKPTTTPATSPVQSSAPPRPPRSPEREGLALAILRRDKAKRAVEALAETIASTREKVWDAQRAVTEAERVTENAKLERARYAIEIALGRTAAPPLTPLEATAALHNAEIEAGAHRETVQNLENLVAEYESALRWAERKLGEAAEAVVRADPRIPSMVERYRVIQREFVSMRRALAFLDGLKALPLEPSFDQTERGLIDIPGDLPWRAALKALESDADAQLPAHA